jgi:hypothetical protein
MYAVVEILNPFEQFSIFSARSCFTNNVVDVIIIHFVLSSLSLYFLTFSILVKNITSAFGRVSLNFLMTTYYKNTKLKTFIFLPLFYYIFFIVFFSNLVGMIPNTYAITSSLIINFHIIFSLFFMINLISFCYHK